MKRNWKTEISANAKCEQTQLSESRTELYTGTCLIPNTGRRLDGLELNNTCYNTGVQNIRKNVMSPSSNHVNIVPQQKFLRTPCKFKKIKQYLSNQILKEIIDWIDLLNVSNRHTLYKGTLTQLIGTLS